MTLLLRWSRPSTLRICEQEEAEAQASQVQISTEFCQGPERSDKQGVLGNESVSQDLPTARNARWQLIVSPHTHSPITRIGTSASL